MSESETYGHEINTLTWNNKDESGVELTWSVQYNALENTLTWNLNGTELKKMIDPDGGRDNKDTVEAKAAVGTIHMVADLFAVAGSTLPVLKEKMLQLSSQGAFKD